MIKRMAFCVPVFALTVGVVLSTFPTVVRAEQLFSDQFTYPNGNLVGQGGWAAHSAAGSKAIQVTGGAAVLQQSASSGEDVNHPFAQQAAGAKTLAEFKLNVPGPTIGTGQDYFIHFRPAGSDSNNFVARCWIGPPTAGGSYDIGIAAGSLSTTPVVPWTSDLTFGQTYKIWILYDGVTGTSTLWVNPVDRNSPSVSSTSAPLAGRLLASIALRQASPTGASYTQVIDDLEVDIAPSPPVPSLSQWGLMALASILVLAGGLYVARRRTATA